MVGEGEEISPTTVLAIIALFSAGDSLWLRDLAESLNDMHTFNEQLSSCFVRLSVPRKERERIQMLLSLWARVRATPPDRFKSGPYKRSNLLGDLIALCEITQFTREDAQRLTQLRSLLTASSEEHPGVGRSIAGRPHRFNRRH
jgi:hypothetical protein